MYVRYCRRLPTSKKLVLLSLAFITAFGVWYHLESIKYIGSYIHYKFRVMDYNWLKEREKFMKVYKERHQATVHQKDALCQIPSLDAFSEDALIYMEKKAFAECNVERFGKIENGVFTLPGDGRSDVSIQYIRRSNAKNKELTKDNDVELSEKIHLTEIYNGKYTYRLTEDSIKVQMYLTETKIKHTEYHTHITKDTENRKTRVKLKELPTGIPLNIIHLMIDSQSRSNFDRQLLKFMPMVYDDENTIILQGQTIIAEGTTSQLLAAFTGHREEDLPEARRGFANSAPVDDFSWIFKKLEKIGYSTMFSETDPKYAAFNYRLHGFRDPPTTHYVRPYWLGQMEWNDYHYCNVKYNLHILKEFTTTYEDEAKFVYCAMGRIAHNDMNLLQVMDDDIADIFQFYKDPIRVNNTIFIVFSDHGARTHSMHFRTTRQGTLEERLPYFSITLPPPFKENYPDLYDNLKWNSQFLTSPYDLFPTYEHLMMYPDQPDESKYVGKSLFTKIDPLKRTCQNSGVNDHWCPCIAFESIDKNQVFVKKGAEIVVKEINRRVLNIGEKSKLCAKLNLKQVVTVRLLKQRTSHTKKNENETRKKIIMSLETIPGNARFEVTFELIGDSFKVDTISRLNRYGTDPECVADEYPHIRNFCFCI